MDYTLTMKLPNGEFQHSPLPSTGTVGIGREAPATVVLADPFLSRLHMQLQCRDGIFSLKDLGSRNGTLVNGVAVSETSLRHGDAIFAGGSSFRLSAVLDGRMGAPLLSAPPQSLSPWYASLSATIQAEFPFAIVDAAIGPEVLGLLKQSGTHFQSLYEGTQAVDLAPDGPFLLDLQSGPHIVPHLIHAGWGKSWGLFLKSAASFGDLRRQLRRWLTVEEDTGRKLLFRFYDPRVLPPFLRAGMPDDRTAFFGKITEFLVESPNPQTAWILAKSADRDHEWKLLPKNLSS